MAIETIGQYQLELIALEAAVAGQGWDPYVSVFKFDQGEQDFKCLLEKHPASVEPLATYEDAIEQARLVGNELVASGRLEQLPAGVRTGWYQDTKPQPAP